jgi:hypothetical protein
LRESSETNEALLYDEELGRRVLQATSMHARSVDEAVELLDRYPWAELVPIQIRPEYMQQILAQLTRGADRKSPHAGKPESLIGPRATESAWLLADGITKGHRWK